MSGPLLLPDWDQLAARVPGITEPMRRYLEQIACVLRPRSVVNTDLALRCFAAFLAETARGATLAQITRRHVEAFKAWLAARPGQNKPAVTPATIAARLGTLRMFFVRIDEWGWDDAPARVPMFPGDLPRLDRPLPKALDDGAAHRAAGQRVHRPAGQCRGPDRRRAMAARPRRQARRGPLPATASPAGHPHR